MLRITNAKTAFFPSKEHYLKFKQSWKAYVNAEGIQSPEHLLIYALLREKPEDHPFTPIKNLNRLVNGIGSEWNSLLQTKNYLTNLTKYKTGYNKSVINSLTTIFGNTISEGTLNYLVSLFQKSEEFTIPGDEVCKNQTTTPTL